MMSTRDTNVIIEHLKSLNKSLRLPNVKAKDDKSASSINEKVNLLNDFFQSVYSLKLNLKVKDIQPENPNLINLSVT